MDPFSQRSELPICNACKGTRAQCRSKTHGKPDDLPVPTAFGHSLTADHKILNEDDASRVGDRVALIILDRYTRWLQGYASKSKNHQESMKAFRRFVGPQMTPDHVYTDNSKELEKALEELNWLHDTSTPYRSQTNGVAERAVRIVKEGTSCTLVQSGFDES